MQRVRIAEADLMPVVKERQGVRHDVTRRAVYVHGTRIHKRNALLNAIEGSGSGVDIKVVILGVDSENQGNSSRTVRVLSVTLGLALHSVGLYSLVGRRVSPSPAPKNFNVPGWRCN